jgi:hypothetical protein
MFVDCLEQPDSFQLGYFNLFYEFCLVYYWLLVTGYWLLSKLDKTAKIWYILLSQFWDPNKEEYVGNDKKILTPTQAIDCGMKPILDEIMPNGEKRFRRIHEDGSGYIRTEATKGETSWQNAHYHENTYELYVVQRGEIVLAFFNQSGELVKLKLSQNDRRTFEPRIHHNVLMAPGSIIHTLKFGACGLNDWHASPELDEYFKSLD